jgi:hypothetical protein
VINPEALQHDLSAYLGDVMVSPFDNGCVAVSLPDWRQIHDEIIVTVRPTSSGYLLSDGGTVSFLLDDDAEKVSEAMECAGISWRMSGTELISAAEGETLVDSIVKFGLGVMSAPVVWHAIACALPAKESAEPSTTTMAREARAHLVSVLGDQVSGFLTVDRNVLGALDTVKAPLQFRRIMRRSGRTRREPNLGEEERQLPGRSDPTHADPALRAGSGNGSSH